MALHPYPAAENVTNFNTLATYVNTVTGNGFFTLIVIGIWVIIFVALKSYETAKAGAAASFTTTVLATLFWAIGLISYRVIVAAVTLTLIFALYNIFQGKSS